MKLSSVSSWLITASAVAISTMISDPVAAQTRASNAAQAADQVGLGEIVVTARRRNESLLGTPVAVTAFDAAELERRSIQQVSEIQKSTPSLVYEATGGNSSDARIFIRGVGNFNPNVSTDPGVGVYIDGVFYGRSQGALISNLDLASVEVLRGPQGTLFGRNTIGGAINITTVKPSTDDFSGSLEAGYGRFNHARVRGSVNIPVNDKIAVRLTGMRDRDDGYSVNDVDGRSLDNIDLSAVSGALRFKATDNLTWDVNAMYSRDRSHGRAGQCLQIAPNPVFGAAYTLACAATNAYGVRHSRSDVKLSGAVDTLSVSSTLAWDIGGIGAIDDLTIKAIGGYLLTDSQRALDTDATSLAATISIDDHRKTASPSGELQLLGQAFDRRLNFVFGAYASREYTPGSGARYLGTYPVLDDSRPIPMNTLRLTKLHNESRALYSQVTYDFNSIVSLTGGLRYTTETKGFFMQKFAVRNDARTTRVGPFTTNGLYTADFKTWTPMSSLQLNAPAAWTKNGFLDRAMLYLTYSKGFKSGGFNGNGEASAGSITEYKPEQVDNYELGLKFSLFDHRLMGSITGYDMRYRDIQLSVQGLDPITLLSTASIFNAGGAKIRGVEFELQTLLFNSLRMSLSGDFTDPRYTKFVDLSVPGGSRVNEPLAFIPKHHISASIENRFSIGDDMALTPRVQLTWTGDRYLGNSPSAIVREDLHAPAVTLVDASLRYDVNTRISFDIYGKNIFNKTYFNDALPVGFVVQRYYAPPATYGATARIKF